MKKLNVSTIIGLMILDVIIFGGLSLFMALVFHSSFATIPIFIGFILILALWGYGT